MENNNLGCGSYRELAYLFILLTVSFLSLGFSQKPEIHSKHFIYGIPLGTPYSNYLIGNASIIHVDGWLTICLRELTEADRKEA